MTNASIICKSSSYLLCGLSRKVRKCIMIFSLSFTLEWRTNFSSETWYDENSYVTMELVYRILRGSSICVWQKVTVA